ncbi:MAG TPA: rhamnogalacturonan acetylesterase [Verrucomicrobiae bacterium]|jgi:Lysophospholipase L1 and related esterases
MRNSPLRFAGLLFTAALLCSCKSTVAEKQTGLERNPAPVVFMIGDSTMANKPLSPAQPERGWGQLLPLYFKPEVRVENLAVNGRSSKSFRDEGRWKTVQENLKPGDYVIIQFGHNDEKADPKRHTDAFGSFKENLERYVRETRQLGGHPLLATPVVRRAFTNGTELIDTHGDYVIAARQAAAEQHVPLLDLQKDTAALISKLGPERSKKLYMWIEPGEFDSVPKGKQDNTHFNAFGATRVCDLAVEEIKTAAPELAKWLRGK